MHTRFAAMAGAAACAALLAAGGAQAQMEEVHADGSVVQYDGASQRMSPGARPTALILGAKRHRHGERGDARAAPAPPPAIAADIHDAAERHHVDEQLVRAVAWQESHYHPAAVSPKGARGTMQLEPSTARKLGVDAHDTAENIDGGVVYLAQLMRRYDGDTPKALAAYNAGPGAVDHYGGVPPYRETRGYVHAIMGRLGGGLADEAEAPLRARMGAVDDGLREVR